MADLLEMVDIAQPGARPVQAFNLEQVDLGAAGVALKERGSFKFAPPEATGVESAGPRRWDGSRTVGQRHGNGQVSARWRVRGSSAQAALDNLATLLALVKNATPGRYLRWRPDGAPYPTYFEVRGPGSWAPDYTWVEFRQTYSVFVDASWPVAPLPLWDQCDVLDDFSVDSRSDYAFDGGASTDVMVTGGALAPVPGGVGIAGVTGVELWLKPESLGVAGSSIASWTDSSGLGNHAVQATGANQPVVAAGVLDGFKSARFDGANDLLSVAGILNNDPTRTVFVVAQSDVLDNQKAAFGWANVACLRPDGAWTYSVNQAGTGQSLGGTPQSFDAITVRFNSSASADGYVNGGAATNFDPNDDFQNGVGARTFTVGNIDDNTRPWDGDIVELIVLSGAATNADKDKVLGYLSDKYPTLGNFGTKPPAANTTGLALTADHRARHTARGYKWLEPGATRKFIPGPTITGFKGGITLRDDGAGNRVEAYVDDNGTNSRLRVDVVLAGVRTNRASVNLAARIVNGTPFWVRARIEGQTMFAEHFTAAPSLSSTATTVAPAGGAGYALTAPEQLAACWTGFTWIPQDAAATMDDYLDHPFYRRGLSLPRQVQWADAIPGGVGVAARTDVVLGLETPAAIPWALVGWARRPSAPIAGSVAPLGVVEAESAATLATWAAAADANYRGGNGLKATAAGAGSASAEFLISPGALAPDEFTESEVDVEVWARVELASTLVSPKVVTSLRPVTASAGAERMSAEYGAAGKLLTKPSAGTAFRYVRLGTVTVRTDFSVRWRLRVAASWAVGSTGTFGLDQLLLVGIGKRAAGPTGRALDASYPRFLLSSAAVLKRLRSDGSGLVDQGGGSLYPDVGIGGQLEIDSGASDSLFALSTLVPDDPTSDATSEARDYVATAHLAVWPRSQFARGG